MRNNPAVIPKRGGFFLHDDRSGDNHAPATGWGATSLTQGEGQAREGGEGGVGEAREELDDEPLGRWRADALPVSGKKGRDGDRDQR